MAVRGQLTSVAADGVGERKGKLDARSSEETGRQLSSTHRGRGARPYNIQLASSLPPSSLALTCASASALSSLSTPASRFSCLKDSIASLRLVRCSNLLISLRHQHHTANMKGTRSQLRCNHTLLIPQCSHHSRWRVWHPSQASGMSLSTPPALPRRQAPRCQKQF